MKLLKFSQWVKLQPANETLKDCPQCNGSKQKKCVQCGGAGDEWQDDKDGNFKPTLCPDCNGEGFTACEYCAGTGKNFKALYDAELKKINKWQQSAAEWVQP